jgi:hypothetical protein
MSKSETMTTDTGKAGEPAAAMTDKELDEKELAIVSGGTLRQQENQEQLRAAETFKNYLAKAGQI